MTERPADPCPECGAPDPDRTDVLLRELQNELAYALRSRDRWKRLAEALMEARNDV